MQPTDPLEDVKHIDYTIQLNGTLNRAYQAEYDKYVEELQHSPTSTSLRQEMEDTIDKVLKDAVEVAEQQRGTSTASPKAPSSPTQSYDEIIPESKWIDHLLTEKRAGNGACYYTDEPPDYESNDEEEHSEDCDKAIAILDDVLENEENTRTYSDVSRASSLSIRDQVATAIVHHAKDESRRTSSAPQDLQKPVFGVIDDTDQKQFIDKLNTLFKQKTLPSRTSKLEFEDEVSSISSGSRKRPSLRHSKTVAANINLLAAEVENETQNTTPSSLEGTQTSDTTDTNNNVTEDSNPKIPQPPPFKAELYNSIASKKPEPSSTEDIISATKAPSRSVKVEINHLQKSSPNDLPTSPPPVDIRTKLEQILRQRVNSVIKSPVVPTLNHIAPVDESITTDTPVPEESNSQPSSFKENARKFDTVEKQKALFSNVLKEMSPAGSNNLKRTSSTSNRISAAQVFDFNNKNGFQNDATPA